MQNLNAHFPPWSKRHAVSLAAALCAVPLPVLLWMPLFAAAQQAPDAGLLLEQTRPVQPVPQPARPVIDAPAAVPALPLDNTPVAVNRFQFEGNQVISSDKLAELLQDQRGAAVPFGQLRAALSRITHPPL
jgi:hemolysin activation/secretion protein